MHIDIKRIGYLHNALEDLRSFYNPTNGETLTSEETDLIKSLTPYFNDLICVLDTLQGNPRFYNTYFKINKREFFIEPIKCRNIKVTEEPISISKLTYFINSNINQDNMIKLKATQITAGLVRRNYLCYANSEESSRDYKIASQQGIELGITTIMKINSMGERYSLNLYNNTAQRFILENLMEIIV